jgi:hypothetical protein
MTNIITPSSIAPRPGLEAAWQDVDSSFDRFCLVAGIGAMEQVLREDAQRLTGPRRAEAASATGGASPRARSASTAVMLQCSACGCAAMTAMRSNCRAGRRPRPRTGSAAGP